ncbi:ATP-binding protein [Streptomyces lydicus]|uniref:ATP-binding protein n=1 Tax=Streptomyces lydicus TaxID=47763 RepID=UPI0036D1DAA5
MTGRNDGQANGQGRVYQASGDQHIIEHHHYSPAWAGPDSIPPAFGREPVSQNHGGSVGVVAQAGGADGGVHVHHPYPSATVVPRQLPAAPAHFTNRIAEMSLLDEAQVGQRPGSPVLVMLTGPGGVGKTALASSWGARVTGDFPDGQLYADLGGSSTEGPVAPAQVLAGFLHALGVAPERVPTSLVEQTTLFRSLTARSQLLVLLDNAVSAAQVRPFLPASAKSMVVVISRWRLGGLLAEGGMLIEVPLFSQEHAVELLSRSAGLARREREGQQIGDLARLCGRLPIALCVAGARLALRPRWPVARVVSDLADEQRRLKSLTVDGGVSVASVFDLSYEGLSALEARAYRWLALHPGPDFGVGVASAVLHLSLHDTTEVLERLVDASVLEDRSLDRYRFHDLIRLHAQQRAATEDTASERDAVVEHAAKYYLSVAVITDHLVMPQQWHVGPAYERDAQAEASSATSREALGRLEPELPNLMAVLQAVAERGLDPLVWQLCEAMWSLFLYRKHFHHWLTAYQLGAEAAARCGNQAAVAVMRHRLGIGYHNLSRSQEALQEGRASLAAARTAGHALAESAALQLMGMALRTQRRFDEAIDVLGKAVELDHRTGQVRSEALAQRLLGQAMYAAGRTEQAVGELRRACELAAVIYDAPVEAMSKVCLAEALTRVGQPSEALELARSAWEVVVDSGSDQYKARAMMAWGQAAEGLEDLPTAQGCLLQARAFFTEAGVPDLQPVQRALSRVVARLADRPPPGDTP